MERSQSAIEATSAPYGHACTNCSRAKTRCIPRASGSCERCYRTKKDCTPSQTVRKRQSSTRTAPASKRTRLEERLDDLVTLLSSQNASKGPNVVPTAVSELSTQAQHPWIPKSWSKGDLRPQQNTSIRTSEDTPRNRAPGPRHKSSNEIVITPSTSAYPTPDSSAQTSRSDELSPAEAEVLLQTFRSMYMRYYPFIYIPATKTADELQRERPYLWLVIRAVCARSISQQQKLATRARQILADQVIVESERSIDLLLGLLAYMGWSLYFMRGKPSMCALCGIATSMVFDLRLDKKARDDSLNSSLNCFKPSAFLKPPAFNPKSRTNEERRAVIGGFFNTAIISCYMKFEVTRYRPNMEEILTLLWEAPETSSDRLLVALTRLMIVVDDTVRLSSNVGEMDTNLAPAFHIKALLASLQQVKSSFSPEISSDNMVNAHMYSAEIVIFELAMSQTSSTSPFKLSDYKRREYLLGCLNAAKGFLDCFLSIEAKDYIAVPFWIMMMFAHAVQVLYRLSVWDDPGWDRSMARQTADIIYYLEQVAAKMQQAQDLGDYDIHGTDGSILDKAAAALKMTSSVWSVNLEQMGVHATPQTGSDIASPTRIPEPLDPMLMDFGDDSWLTDMFASWEGH